VAKIKKENILFKDFIRIKGARNNVIEKLIYPHAADFGF